MNKKMETCGNSDSHFDSLKQGIKAKKINNRYYNMIIFACFFIYTVSVGAKIAYTSAIAEIIDFFNITKPQASLASTYYYITYAVSQIVLIAFLNKLDMRKFFLFTFIGSGVTYFVIALLGGMNIIYVCMGLSGIFHSGAWGGSILILSRYVPKKRLSNINVTMSAGYAIGISTAYGLSALFIATLSWHYSFAFWGIMLFVAAIILFIILGKANKHLEVLDKKTSLSKLEKMSDDNMKSTNKNEKNTERRVRRGNVRIYNYILLLFFPFIFMGLYHGIVGWLPNMLKEVYKIETTYAILITFIVPIIAIFGPILNNMLLKRIKNIAVVCILYMLMLIPLSLMLYFVLGLNIVLSLILSTVCVIIIKAATNIFSIMIPLKLKDTINSGASAAASNAMASFGVSLMPLVFSFIIDSGAGGWGLSYFIIIAFALFSLILLFIIKPFFAEKKI